MEDQGKRLLLAVAIAFGIMLAWNFLFPPEKPPEEESAEKDAASQKVERDQGEDAPESVEPEERSPDEEAAPAERGEEQFYDLEFDKFRARFSSYGGSLVSWELLGTRYEDPKTGEPTDLASTGEEEALRNFQVHFPDSTLTVPEETEWEAERRGPREIAFTWSSSELEIEKLFEIVPDEYLLRMTVTVRNLTEEEAKQALAVTTYGFQDPELDTGGGFVKMPREWKAACYLGDDVHRHGYGGLLKEPRERAGEVRWTGFTHSYFLSAVAPNRAEVPESARNRFECGLSAVEDRPGVMRSDLVYSHLAMDGGDLYRRSVVSYLGPKYLDELETVSAEIDKEKGYSPSFEEAVDLGWLTVLARPLLWLLKWFQGFLVNWGLAIIFLTVVVKGVTLPWTHKSMKSMKAMAKLKPQMEKIREKYADDKQRQQVETMNLFKAHKVNPLAGCLPILLQMPIWIALYRALTVAAELYQAPFIPGWIDDLTRPDPFYIMPILLTGMMFLQSRLTPMAATGAQQKMMQYGMPLMFGVFSFFFPAGLTLYIFTNTVLTALHHLFMHKGKKKEGEDGAAGEDDGAGKAVIEASASEAAPKGEAPGSKAGGGGKKPQGQPQRKKSGGKKSGKKKKRRS